MEDSTTMSVEAAQAEEIVAEEAAPKKKQKKPINQAKLQDNLWGWIFCIPLIIGTVWFVYVCLVSSLALSFSGYTKNNGNMFTYLFNSFKTPQGIQATTPSGESVSRRRARSERNNRPLS